MFRTMRRTKVKEWFVVLLIVGIILAVYMTTYAMSRSKSKQHNYYPLQNSLDAHTGVEKFEPAVIRVQQNSTHKILNKVLSGIKAADEYLLKQYKPLKIDSEMLEAAYHKDKRFEMLEATLLRVLFTGEPLKIGIIGGSISEGSVLAGDQFVYYNILAYYLELMTNRTVEIHRGVIAATDSSYYSFCLNQHLDLQDVHIVLWELAVNDHVVKLRPFPQEELTRYILQQPSKPQLIYVNFINAVNLRQKRCVTNERIGSRLLSQHYKIPSINLSNATCKDIRQGRSHYLSAYDYYHPSRRAHTMVALFLVNLFRDSLLNIVHNLLQEPANQLEYLKYLNEMTRASNTIPTPLFDSTRIAYPHCWTSLANTPTQLQPIYINGWELTEDYADAEPSDIIKETVEFLNKTAWGTRKGNKDIVFRLNIERYGDFLATVAIATIGCPSCGKARIIIDNILEINKVINTYWAWTRIVTHSISTFVTSGQHTLRIHSLNNKPLTIISIMVAYDMKTTLDDLDAKMVELENMDEESVESEESVNDTEMPVSVEEGSSEMVTMEIDSTSQHEEEMNNYYSDVTVNDQESATNQ